jgi:hypothetical protein
MSSEGPSTPTVDTILSNAQATLQAQRAALASKDLGQPLVSGILPWWGFLGGLGGLFRSPALPSKQLPGGSPDTSSAAKDTLAELDSRTARLQQVNQLLHADPELLRLVDTSIFRHVQAAEQRQAARAKSTQRRQALFTVVLTVMSLVVGWLLSAISPVSTVAHLVGR